MMAAVVDAGGKDVGSGGSAVVADAQCLCGYGVVTCAKSKLTDEPTLFPTNFAFTVTLILDTILDETLEERRSIVIDDYWIKFPEVKVVR